MISEIYLTIRGDDKPSGFLYYNFRKVVVLDVFDKYISTTLLTILIKRTDVCVYVPERSEHPLFKFIIFHMAVDAIYTKQPKTYEIF